VKVHPLLTEDTIIVDLHSLERDAVLEEMAQFLKDKEVIGQEKELLEKLIQREKLGSTAIGEGISIPHCKLKEVKNAIVGVAISKKGVDFGSIDKKPTHIFFLVISSPENPSLSLQILAAIAQLVRKSSPLARKIMGAKYPRKVIEVIREEEENLNE
jgi:nitrogen PTS system EIIA component